MAQSFAAGRAVRLNEVHTVADGLAAPYAGDMTYLLTRRYVDDVVVLPDDSIVDAMRQVLAFCKLVVEPAGAAAVAALLEGRVPIAAGDTVVAVLSGGNIDLDRLKNLL